ncbi:MAG: hypothetical protein OXU23_09355, partial [Candidatus Poribacteria bacterium]|nr:hypothetical protein [Candidatus Poribacteria bacterium]
GMHKRTLSIKINLEDVNKQLLYMFIVQNDELKDHNLIPEFYRLLSNKGACKYTAKYTLVPNRIIHINKVTRIYMGFYTKSDLILHPDQAIVFDNEYNPGVDQENYNTMVINIKDVVSVISKGEYQNIIAFTPFYFKLFIGSNKSYDRDCDKLIDLSNFTSKSDIDQDFSLDIQQHDIDMPPKSYRSSAIFSLGKWAKK